MTRQDKNQAEQLDRLARQMKRFIRGGLREVHFTQDLYDLLHLETGLFIAHYDRHGFYDVRFRHFADQTAALLRACPKAVLKPLCDALADAIEARVTIVPNTTTRSSVND